MPIDLQDIPSTARPPRGEVRTRLIPAWRETALNDPRTRRTFLKAAGAAGTAVGLAALGVFPPARKAFASHVGTDGYQIKDLPCPDDPFYDNNAPCDLCGPSDNCPSCCIDNSSYHKYGWHKAGNDDPTYDLRKGDCVPNNDYHDGWKWDRSGCCGCNSYIKVRCHDGWKNTSSGWTPTICKWTLDSTYGGQSCGCPPL